MDYIIPTPVGEYISDNGFSKQSTELLDSVTTQFSHTDDVVSPHGFAEHREEIAQRIKQIQNPVGALTAVYDNIYVFPSNTAPYSIRYDDTYDGEFMCGGSDFRYRGFEQGFDCKHILVLRNAIRCGVIAPPNTPVDEWVNKRIPHLVECAMNIPMCDTVADKIGEDLGRLRIDPYNTSFGACLWNIIGTIEMGEYPGIEVTVPKDFEVTSTEYFFSHENKIAL